KRQVIRGIVVAMNYRDGSRLSDYVEDRIDRWTVKTRRPAGYLFGKLLFLEVDFAKATPDSWIEVDHFLDVVSRPRVFQIESAHQRIDSRAVCIWQRQKFVRHQHVLDGVVIHDLAIGLRVVNGREVTINQWIMGHCNGEAHQRASANVRIHHLQDRAHRRTVGLEVLDMKVLIVVKAVPTEKSVLAAAVDVVPVDGYAASRTCRSSFRSS